jgi:hypothetical protein
MSARSEPPPVSPPTAAAPPLAVAPAAPPPLLAHAPSAAELARTEAQSQPQPQPQSCSLTVPNAPHPLGVGAVVAFENRSVSLARIKGVERTFGGTIDPAYINNQRVIVRMPNGQEQVMLQPDTVTVRPGDRVTMQDSYKSPTLPCSYIPNLITGDLGPAPQPDANGSLTVR